MKFEEWEPYYREICEYFAFDPGLDEEAACVLATLLRHDDLPALDALSRGQDVTVCGNAPCLRNELDRITGRIFAADAAAEVLMAGNIRPDAVFTDLDGATGLFPLINEAGTVMVVHAHGDNIPLLRFWMPQFSGPVVATTQGMPFDGVHNFGGFTDGDRAVFAAHALGADRVRIIGFDLDDENVDPMKRGKLRWARRLLALLGHAC
jgi:2-amino-4-hydroxy-6-hydroxymethyldihydropteridine diphosphokinase